MSNTLTQPDFMDTFACKCSACRRSCCNGDWNIIQITRDEFLADYDPALGKETYHLAQYGLRRNPKSTSDKDYGYCAQDADGLCVYLTDEGLCQWKCTTGTYIGSTCDDFPRASLLYCGDAYLFPTCACEEVLETLLVKDDPITLITDNSGSDRTAFNTVIDESDFVKRPLLKHYPLLRQTGLAILQDRSRSLDERMTILAHMMTLIDYAEKAGQTDTVPATLERFMEADNLDAVAQRYRKEDLGPQAFLLTTAQMLMLLANIPNTRDMAVTAMQGLGIPVIQPNEDGTGNNDIPLTAEALDIDAYQSRKDAFDSYLRDKECFLEHIMVSVYLRELIPFTYNDVWTSFRAFNAIYAFHKALIYGLYEEVPSDEELIDTCVLLHRKVIHTPHLMNQVLKQTARLGLIDLPTMAALANG